MTSPPAHNPDSSSARPTPPPIMPPGSKKPETVQTGVPPTIPRPRSGSPFTDALRGAPPQPLRVRSTKACADLDPVLADVREVSVWTSGEGALAQHAKFLLQDGDRTWHSVEFSSPLYAELIDRLRTLPGFDTDRLLDLVGSHIARVVALWRVHPEYR